MWRFIDVRTIEAAVDYLNQKGIKKEDMFNLDGHLLVWIEDEEKEDSKQ